MDQEKEESELKCLAEREGQLNYVVYKQNSPGVLFRFLATIRQEAHVPMENRRKVSERFLLFMQEASPPAATNK